MVHLSPICLWVCLCAASPASFHSDSSAVTAGDKPGGGVFWFTVTSAGALYEKAGPYVLSGCVSQSPVSTPGSFEVNGYYIVGGFWSSECNVRANRDRDEVLISSLKPGAFRLYRNYPNPFRIGTRVAYDLPARSEVCLSIYDAAGRQVRELASGWQEAGRYSLNWDGKDKMGRTCPSGVYFCSLKTEHQKDVKKMLIAE